MKKLILILAILVVASPAFAALDVNIVKLAGTQVQIRYTGADVNNLPRAFALAFEVNNTGVDVCGIGQYKGGESVAGTDPCSRGFGIYPATIVIEANIVTGWGTPLADKNDPLPSGADQILPSKNFVLEFGSLYAPPGVGSANAPGVDGNLCVLSYEPNGVSGSFTIKMYSENVYRGGVVLEDGTTADVNKSLTIVTGPPQPGKATIISPTLHQTGVSKNTALSWGAGSDANSHRIFMGPNSAANLAFQVEQAGTTFKPALPLRQGTTWYWRIDEKNDTGTTTGDVWDFNTASCLALSQVFLKTVCDPCSLGDPCLTANLTISQTMLDRWHYVGDPNCWCCNGQKCGNAIYTAGVNIGRVDTSD